MTIGISDLGLAAFAKTKQWNLLNYRNKVFYFEATNEQLLDLEVEYANSCCRQHDANLVFLRHILARSN